MGLISAIWQKLVWCGLIGGCFGLVSAVMGVFQKSSVTGQNSIVLDFFVDAAVGTLFGLVLLGVPASMWVFGKWAFHGGKIVTAPAVPGSAQDVVHEAGRAAMAGSTAAVPGAIAGGLGGAALGGICLCLLFLLMIFTGAPWYDNIVKHYAVVWFASFIGGGAALGLFGGWFLGSAVGAIFGGVRSLSRH